jgi:F0F1-type ATP synthase membrane subunit b/b'
LVIDLIKLVAHVEIIDVKMITMLIISVVMGGMIMVQMSMVLSSRDRNIHDHLENIQKERTNIEIGDREFGV